MVCVCACVRACVRGLGLVTSYGNLGVHHGLDASPCVMHALISPPVHVCYSFPPFSPEQVN